MIIVDVHKSDNVTLVFTYYIDEYGNSHILSGEVIDTYKLYGYLLVLLIKCYIMGLGFTVAY